MYLLNKTLAFPNPNLASSEGLVAVGGDLSPQRLLTAYQNGIFPWFNEEDPILWWSPNPRCILQPSKIKISKSMRQVLRKNTFKVTYDTVFSQVIQACATTPRFGQTGTWITPEMQTAYEKLHELGWCHSVEVWQGEKLVGGLYGVSLGRCFFGESMFSHTSNASKTALIHLTKTLDNQSFSLIDCQMTTQHLLSMGAEEISRNRFLDILERSNQHKSIHGSWEAFSE